MEIFFWVITTAYWVIYFPLYALAHWKASQMPQVKVLKRIDEGRYYGLFIWSFIKTVAIGTALIGCLIYFS